MLAPDTHLKERYRILHKIGGGGFGLVYKAIDEVFGCCVAIKETKEEVVSHDKLKKAFEREAKLLRNLKHDCLPRVTDYFIHDETQFLVMDFIEGEDLAALLKQRLGREGPFTVSEILPWADRILSALEYLHSRPEPIIHRDIKPSNIKLADDGGIYLLDFGLAKGSAGQMSTMLQGQSSFSVAAFTHEYAPLEQLQDTGTQPQSDIYALGATLYHLLTGQYPVSASKRDEAIQRGLSDPLGPAHQVNPAIPLGISQIISQAMIVRWWDRLASAKEMRAALAVAAADFATTLPKPNADLHSIDPSVELSNEDIRVVRDHSEAHSKGSVPTAPTQAGIKPKRFRRPWLVATFSLVLLTSITVGGWLAFSRWFVPKASTKASNENPTSEKAESLKPLTPSNLQVTRSPPGHAGTVWSIAFSPDGNLAASAGDDGTIILWDTKTWNQKPAKLMGHAGPVYSVAFSLDGKTLASASKDTTIRLWDAETSEFIKTLSEGTKPVFLLAFSPDATNSSILVSVSGEPEEGGDEIRIWYSNTGWQSRVLPFISGGIELYAISISPNGNTLAAAGKGKLIHLWNLKTMEKSKELAVDQPPSAFVSRLTFSPDGKYLVAGNSDGDIKMWTTEKWEETKPLGREHQKVITAIAFSPDNVTLISASKDRTVRRWNIATGTSKLLATLDKISQSLAFSSDGQTLLSGGEDHSISVWQKIAN